MSCSRHLLQQKMSHHLDLVIESGGRCVDSRHGTESGCEGSRSGDGEGFVIVGEETGNDRAGWSKCQLPFWLNATGADSL